MQKQQIKDFLCAGTIFSIILIALVLISGKDFFQNAIYFDRSALSFKFFDTKISLDKSVLTFLSQLGSFYTGTLGKSLVSCLENAVIFCADYASLLLGFLYRLACVITGASV